MENGPMKRKSSCMAFIVVVAVTFAASLIAQERPPAGNRAIRVTENLHVLPDAGGNIALFVGDDGALQIDSGVPELADKVAAVVKDTAKMPVRFLINTHWHFDHVGGNEKSSRTGATIIAHENVRRRMSSEQHIAHIDQKLQPSPPAALPVITYADTLTLYWNGDEVQIIHLEPAHTDGDGIVFFRKANVLHAGDIYFARQYPFIDVRAGGSIDGMIKAVDRILSLADEKTKIIPGHGPISNAAELRVYREMLATARDQVRALVQQGKSKDEVIAARPTRDLDEKWGRGSFAPDKWVGIVYDGMTQSKSDER
jgi:cyclase